MVGAETLTERKLTFCFSLAVGPHVCRVRASTERGYQGAPIKETQLERGHDITARLEMIGVGEGNPNLQLRRDVIKPASGGPVLKLLYYALN